MYGSIYDKDYLIIECAYNDDETEWIDNGVRQEGAWKVAAGFRGGIGGNTRLGGGELLFNVAAAPEPISSVLFLLGGAVLGIKRFRKKSV